MARRSKSREIAMQMLYQTDLNPDIDGMTVRKMIDEQLRDESLRTFAWQLFAGVMEWRSMLDAKIESAAENWSLARMAPTDRNALRIGVFELLHTETPHRVVIDEAIELARKFGSKQSPQFVNGILDRLIPEDRKSAESVDDGDGGE